MAFKVLPSPLQLGAQRLRLNPCSTDTLFEDRVPLPFQAKELAHTPALAGKCPPVTDMSRERRNQCFDMRMKSTRLGRYPVGEHCWCVWRQGAGQAQAGGFSNDRFIKLGGCKC